MREESEGSKVTVPAGYAPDEYRLVGKIRGEAPFSGVLVHHGWRTEWVKLPRLLRTGDDRLPTIAPSEIELNRRLETPGLSMWRYCKSDQTDFPGLSNRLKQQQWGCFHEPSIQSWHRPRD